MTWPIRTRLTVWYLAIVVVVLVSSVFATSIAQRRLAGERLDQELERTMATLRGVMRTEFGEGLDLRAATDEASIEVVAPGRGLGIATLDDQWLEFWGLASLTLSPSMLPDLGTVETPSGQVRVLRHTVDDGPGQRYVAVVVAPLAGLDAEHAEMLRALWIGVALALVVAGAGGWVIGLQALKPLATMAHEAGRGDADRLQERLTVAHPGDEIGRVAVAFNGLLDRLTAALDQQRQFMADASHELRTPVSVIRTTAQVTLNQPQRVEAEYRESLTIMGEQAERLARIVDAMFLLSRAEAAGVPLQQTYVNLDEVADECVRAARVLARERNVSLVQRGAEEVGLVVDDNLLRRLIGNLLDNAIRHATPGSEVVVDVAATQTDATLRVTNTGEQVPESEREHIFQRFVRLGPSEGAGLGLPIARWIARAHGGTVGIETSGGDSTTFVVTLPKNHTSSAAAG